MQITVTIPDDLAAEAQARGLTPSGYVERLIAEQTVTAAPVKADAATRLADLELFFEEMAAHSHKLPILSEDALTRESFYQDHD